MNTTDMSNFDEHTVKRRLDRCLDTIEVLKAITDLIESFFPFFLLSQLPGTFFQNMFKNERRKIFPLNICVIKLFCQEYDIFSLFFFVGSGLPIGYSPHRLFYLRPLFIF